MSSQVLRSMLAGMLFVAMTLFVASDASAQCATCATPVVAYHPVVAQPAVAYRPYTGWYPGKWLDQWRLRRAGVSASAPAYSAAYAPTYTAAYAPTYTAAYAPTYTAAYRPYVTSFAPLSAPVAATCNTCAHTALMPVVQTLARPVLMRPVVAAHACNTCNFTPSCGCNACSTGVSQAVFSEPACSGCGGGSMPSVVAPNSSGPPIVGPPTGQPSFAPVPAPTDSQYQKSNRPVQGGNNQQDTSPSNGDDPFPLKEFDSGPTKTEADASTYYNAPLLLDPRDRTAARSYNSRKPTVNVWTAVYRGSTNGRSVSQTSAHTRTQADTRSQADTRTQADIDAEGWTAVPRNR